jgi:LysM repeat protein
LIKSCFRVFETPQESYIEHTEFLSNPKKAFRYGELFKLAKTDYKGWAKGLKKAGYATNPNYPKLLITVIENNDLSKYDVMTLADLDSEFTENYPNQRENIKNRKYTKVNEFNKVDFAYAKEGDTPQDVANRFSVSTRNLVKFNELKGIKIFEQNEKVYLENKRTKYSGGNKLHRVQDDETMQNIAQRYGIKTKWLYWRNRIKQDQEPVPGQQIKLRGWNFDDIKTVRQGTNTSKPKPPKDNTNTTTEPEPSGNDGYLDEIVPPSAQKIKHTVKKGDTLYGIARQYGVPVDKIKELNNLTSNVLDIGQELIIK